MAKNKNKHKRTPKAVLKLPDLEQSKSAVLNSLTSVSSQRSYDHAIREFIEWYCSEPRLAFNKTVVTRYRISLEQAHYASSTINLRLAAVRRLAYEASDSGLLSPDLAAGIRRVKGAKKLGVRIGNWLTAEQGVRLLTVFDIGSIRGKRDYAMGRGRDASRPAPPAQIRTCGITAYGSSLGFERQSERQDRHEEYVDEESTGQRSAEVVPNRASAVDCGGVGHAASIGRAVLEIGLACSGSPAQRGIGNNPRPPSSATPQRAPLAHASSGVTGA